MTETSDEAALRRLVDQTIQTLVDLQGQINGLERRIKTLEGKAGITRYEPFITPTAEKCRDGKEHDFPATLGRRRVDDPPPHCRKCGMTKP